MHTLIIPVLDFGREVGNEDANLKAGMLSVLDRDDTERLYRLVKSQLKQWEAAFLKKHGRAANKHDIGAIPEVSAQYAKFRRLKTQREANSKPQLQPQDKDKAASSKDNSARVAIDPAAVDEGISTTKSNSAPVAVRPPVSLERATADAGIERVTDAAYGSPALERKGRGSVVSTSLPSGVALHCGRAQVGKPKLASSVKGMKAGALTGVQALKAKLER